MSLGGFLSVLTRLGSVARACVNLDKLPKVSKTRFDSDTIALDKTFHGAPSGQSSEAQTTKQRTHEPLNKELNITGAPELRFIF